MLYLVSQCKIDGTEDTAVMAYAAPGGHVLCRHLTNDRGVLVLNGVENRFRAAQYRVQTLSPLSCHLQGSAAATYLMNHSEL